MREVFAYYYAEIARIVGKSQANCRQLAKRARHRIESGKFRFEVSREEQTTLAHRFFAACQDGDVDGLVTLLASNAAFYGDGGNKGTGVPHPVYGRDNVVKLLLGLFRVAHRLDVQLLTVEVNAQPGGLCRRSAAGPRRRAPSRPHRARISPAQAAVGPAAVVPASARQAVRSAHQQ
jgi:ketosteroid isomerase-like protein